MSESVSVSLPRREGSIALSILRQCGDAVDGLLDWSRQPSGLYGKAERLDFARRMLELSGYFDDQWNSSSLSQWRLGIALLFNTGGYRQQELKEIGVVFDDVDDDLVLAQYDIDAIAFAWMRFIASYPTINGTMHFKLFGDARHTCVSKSIYFVTNNSDYYTWCHSCQEWYHSPPENFFSYGSIFQHYEVCEYCAEDLRFCESCGRYVWQDEYNSSHNCCNDCDDSRSAVSIVDASEDVVFFDTDTSKDKTHFAFELEWGCCENRDNWSDTIVDVYDKGELLAYPDDDTPTHFFLFKSDCSIVGPNKVELITQPFTKQWFAENHETIEYMLDRFNKYFVTGDAANAGLHIHVDGTAFSERMLWLIGRFLYHPNNQNFIARLSGRTELHRLKWAKPIWMPDGAPWGYHVEYWKTYHSRYTAMNLRSLETHNTVEFRLFAGTGNFKILKARLEIISSLINLARVWRDVETLITPKNLLGYMAKHGASDMALTLMTE